MVWNERKEIIGTLCGDGIFFLSLITPGDGSTDTEVERTGVPEMEELHELVLVFCKEPLLVVEVELQVVLTNKYNLMIMVPLVVLLHLHLITLLMLVIL